MTKDEAIHKALKVLNCLNNDRVYETAWVKGAINACEEALEQQAQEPLTRAQQVIRANNTAQPTQEPVAWMKSALDNARDVCKYLDHDMVKEAKAHTQFFWNDLDKIREFDNTHPHQDKTSPSKWTALTDDEIQELTHDGVADEYDIKFARAVLAKAKEKNYYGPT